MDKTILRRRAVFYKYLNICTIAMMILIISAVPVLADNPSASEIFGSFIGIMVAMFRWVGICLIAWGIIQFIMALRRTDGESKSDAIQIIVCGLVLISLDMIFKALDLGVEIQDVEI